MTLDPALSEHLCTMIRANRGEAVEALLKAGKCDVNYRSDGGQTSLHIAAGAFMEHAIRLLIANGAEINAVDRLGRTPLIMAARAGDEIAAKMLIDAGADLDHITHTMGWTALMSACRYRRTSIVAILLEAGANRQILDRNDKSALEISHKFGATGAVGLLSRASNSP